MPKEAFSYDPYGRKVHRLTVPVEQSESGEPSQEVQDAAKSLIENQNRSLFFSTRKIRVVRIRGIVPKK